MNILKMQSGILKQNALFSKFTGMDTPAAQSVKLQQAKKAAENKTGLSFAAESIGLDTKGNKSRVVKLASTGKVVKVLSTGYSDLAALEAI